MAKIAEKIKRQPNPAWGADWFFFRIPKFILLCTQTTTGSGWRKKNKNLDLKGIPSKEHT
jgi:hypothetical protein